jgi:hypothetical protein
MGACLSLAGSWWPPLKEPRKGFAGAFGTEGSEVETFGCVLVKACCRLLQRQSTSTCELSFLYLHSTVESLSQSGVTIEYRAIAD